MNASENIGAGLSGIEQLRALMRSGERRGIVETLDFNLSRIDEGEVEFEGIPGLAAYNPIGTVHGGYAATLLDSACGCAVQTRLAAGQRYTTLELKVAYHRAMTVDTGRVRAIGTVMTFGRRAAFAEARLLDDADRLLASATSSLLVLS